MSSFTFQPIGYLATPFADKFGIPRQPGLAPNALGVLKLLPPYNRSEAVRGLEDFSHVWLTFVFHQSATDWKPTVRPPRLGGNTRIGVFASRSPFRPNPIGLSLVELIKVDTQSGATLTFKGIDLVDGTPILDIKPYIPYAESIPDARGGFADSPPPELKVVFTPDATARLIPGLRELIEDVLKQDPRPAYAHDADRIYGVRLYQFDVKWRCDGQTACVIALEKVV
ncbi:tRNA (N6-threonylcarbamoyladenosine(37)-N6)-methyltransferase TrmO [Iodobacter sp. HSC-16F04]|uniref:tRNA (N6-threonylcarbamoyladenosine(37)-N6)-methyltransferase TrmO n=1 Tax=Iodobacter violaceini TaxID=3044271 RepID=A0ABX0L1S3_9NEIS|nr:tRNA (N6-threonylcarbamoyladenosine(37)-N6)-methyltransferase TrmO [Iodobacter violacea]NHQ88620.1 tRNA (N6-threonylcarbamoyladenosine(37)-N6)-methyltransferase TrmO [Iodobacter violacea]